MQQLVRELVGQHDELRGWRKPVQDLVISTDGVNDPPDAARERRAFDEITTWWRSRPATTRIVVGADSNSTKSAPLQTLAKSLGARIITPEAFARESIIERAVVHARPVTTAPASTVMPASETASTNAGWVVTALVVLLIAGFVVRRRLRGRGLSAFAESPEPIMVLPIAPSVRRDLVVRVAGHGRVNEQVLDIDSLPEGGLTLGAAGIIPIIGLPGTPVVIDTISGELVVTVEPGHGVRIDGQLVDATHPMHIGRACTITAHGSAISLQVRRMDEPQNVVPLRVGGVRRGA